MRRVSDQFHEDDEGEGSDSLESLSEDETREDEFKVNAFIPVSYMPRTHTSSAAPD